MPRQRAIITYRHNVETLVLESTLQGEGDRFAWIIPNPNLPLRVEKMSPGLLKTLSLRLAPNIFDVTRPHPLLIEFESKKPVYPMRLSSLPGRKIMLEIILIADQMGVPENYDLKKIFCDSFTTQSHHEFDTPMFVRNSGELVNTRFGVLWPHGIGHPDNQRFMWDGCVVTKYTGEVSDTQMQQDMFFSLENPEPFIAVVYSHGGALLLGLLMASAVMFGAAFVLPIYRKTKAGTPTNMRIAVLVVLPVVCLVTVLAAYLVNPNKIISHQLNGVPIVLLD